ncbi:acyl-CoA dehydrogenase family protein [Pseudarthrobacter sulfonivorans]|uniref:acyl-CoA dehydrogenase family protein n=1 Tax=Pseudarthrobacter sulfonivorans TaxID=121292 RepID=UPI00277F714D|nr:acyl-CoA dehydrogenase family protein [Pseudarthrobacter sulfonivorans]MDP9998458.1 alkylation response protein AidB-like acyl-CoA dehydrogenase [Pseudarthrobacter sulfonivorans]
MASVFNAEQSDLRRMVRKFCDENFGEAAIRRIAESELGYDPAVWEKMATELGLQGIAIPEEFEGSGAGQIELNIVIEELGRALATTPFFSSIALGANLILATDDAAAKQRYLPGIAEGTTIATVAFLESSASFEPGGITAEAHFDGDTWKLNGTKLHVLDAVSATMVIVAARTAAGISLFAVDANADGLTIEAQETLDITRRQSRLILHAAPGTLLGAEGTGWDALQNMLVLASVALASENAGGALRIVEESAEYARTRKQFGKVIGSYQAIKQKMADMLLEVEMARAAAHRVAQAADEDPGQLPFEAAMAHALTADAYVKAAYDNIQIHGGIGFTWEHTAHLYFRRAKANELLFGTPDHHRERAAQLMGL